MGYFKHISIADNPRMVQHFLYCQYLVREFLEKELDEHHLKPALFDKWYKRLEWVQTQLSNRDKEIISEIYRP